MKTTLAILCILLLSGCSTPVEETSAWIKSAKKPIIVYTGYFPRDYTLIDADGSIYHHTGNAFSITLPDTIR